MAAALVLLAIFWYLRLADNVNAMPSGDIAPFNALANVRRFIAQHPLSTVLVYLTLAGTVLRLGGSQSFVGTSTISGAGTAQVSGTTTVGTGAVVSTLYDSVSVPVPGLPAASVVRLASGAVLPTRPPKIVAPLAFTVR